MNIKNFFRGTHCEFLLAVVALAVYTSRTEGANIPLTNVTPGVTNTYSYTTNAVDDPNATRTNGVSTDGAGSYIRGNAATSGTLSYTFDLAPYANNLNLSGASLFANNFSGSTSPTDGISLAYTLSGGNSGSGNLFSLLTSNYTSGSVVIPSFTEHIALTPANTDTFVTVTFTTNSADGSNFQEQILRAPQPFVATATFVPEPSSFILCGLGALGLFIAARRRRKA